MQITCNRCNWYHSFCFGHMSCLFSKRFVIRNQGSLNIVYVTWTRALILIIHFQLIYIQGSEMCLWLICILFPITRTFFFGAQVVILLEIFPGSVFGKVYGISVMSAGAGSFIANKVFLLAPNFVYVHCILAVLIILTFSFPFYLYKYHPRKSV